jgi:hypothetical protein
VSVLGPTGRHVVKVPGACFLVVKRTERKADYRLNRMPNLRIQGAIPPVLHTYLRHGVRERGRPYICSHVTRCVSASTPGACVSGFVSRSESSPFPENFPARFSENFFHQFFFEPTAPVF